MATLLRKLFGMNFIPKIYVMVDGKRISYCCEAINYDDAISSRTWQTINQNSAIG